MTPVVDMSTFFAETAESDIHNLADDDCLSLVRQEAENRLLNTQALIEYTLLKARLFSSIAEANKFFELDDQIIVQEYKFCASLSYRKRVFVMEFRQINSETNQCNHALELLFRGLSSDINNDGHSTLILARENKQFIWRQLHSIAGGPSGASRILVSLILRWLQNDSSLYLCTAPSLALS